MDPSVPLSIPEVNPEALEGSPKIVAVPNCTIIATLLAVAPLHRAADLTSLVLTSFQSVSGAGHKGVSELLTQVEKLRGDEESLAHPVHEALPAGEIFGKTIAYNVVAKIGGFLDDGFSGEEVKVMAEARKILGLPGLPVVATTVRVPVVVGHGVSILAEFARPISVAEAREAISAAAGVELRDDPANDVYPSPLDAAGGDNALAGRIRQVPGRDDALVLFSCADNLRKGAALNAVQIAEHLFVR
jgi:aspartate-semialdehyde dehydrogenase